MSMITREELMAVRKTQLAAAALQCKWRHINKSLSLQLDAATAKPESLINFLLTAQESGYDLHIADGKLTATPIQVDEQTQAQMARVEVEDADEGDLEAAETGEATLEEVVAEEEQVLTDAAVEAEAGAAEAQASFDPAFLINAVTEAMVPMVAQLSDEIGKLSKAAAKQAKADQSAALVERLDRVEQGMLSMQRQLDRIENIGLWMYALTDEARPSSYFQEKPGCCLEEEEAVAAAAEEAASSVEVVKKHAAAVEAKAAGPMVAPPPPPPVAPVKAPAPAAQVDRPAPVPAAKPAAVSAPAAKPVAGPTVPRMSPASTGASAPLQTPVPMTGQLPKLPVSRIQAPPPKSR